jgi:hypothetical protein
MKVRRRLNRSNSRRLSSPLSPHDTTLFNLFLYNQHKYSTPPSSSHQPCLDLYIDLISDLHTSYCRETNYAAMPSGQRFPTQPPARLRGSIARGGKSALLPDVEVEDFGPPEWRTPFNSRADLGMSNQTTRGVELTHRLSRFLPFSTWIQSARGCIDRGKCHEGVHSQTIRRSYCMSTLKLR